MKALCSMDLIYLVISMVTRVADFMMPLNPSLISKITAYTTAYLDRIIVQSAGASSIFLVVIIAVDRFVAICFPLWITSSVLTTHPRVFVIMTTIFNFLFMSPNFLRYKIVLYQNPVYNQTMWRTVDSDFKLHMSEFFRVHVIAGEVLYRYIVVGIVLVCNITTITYLWIAAKKRKKLTLASSTNQTQGKPKQEMKATRMLLGVATLFLFCVAPGVAQTLSTRINPDLYFYRKQHYLFLAITYLTSLLMKINSSANILIYYSLNSAFRSTFKHIFHIEKQAHKVTEESSQMAKSTQAKLASSPTNK